MHCTITYNVAKERKQNAYRLTCQEVPDDHIIPNYTKTEVNTFLPTKVTF